MHSSNESGTTQRSCTALEGAPDNISCIRSGVGEQLTSLRSVSAEPTLVNFIHDAGGPEICVHLPIHRHAAKCLSPLAPIQCFVDRRCTHGVAKAIVECLNLPHCCTAGYCAYCSPGKSCSTTNLITHITQGLYTSCFHVREHVRLVCGNV